LRQPLPLPTLEGILQARQIFTGNRAHGEIEFDGTILATDSDLVFVQILEGLTVPVKLEDITRVRGNLIPGSFVEVEGIFDSSLDLIAYEIAVDSDGDEDADDDHPDGSGSGDDQDNLEIGSEIASLVLS